MERFISGNHIGRNYQAKTLEPPRLLPTNMHIPQIKDGTIKPFKF
jgi:hypothetical protein